MSEVDETADATAGTESEERGRERLPGTRVVTLELSRARIERLVSLGLLDHEGDDRTIGAAVKRLIDGEEMLAAPAPDGRELCVPVMLDPEELAFLVESQLLPVHGPADSRGMARVFKKLLSDARAHWLQFNAPRRSAGRPAIAAAPLPAAELAEIGARHRALPSAATPVRVVPREAQKAYLRAWQQTGQWPREWGPLPDEPGTVIVDDDVRAVFGLDPIARRG